MSFYQFDHLVLTVADLNATLEFYTQVWQIPVIDFGAGRKALQIGHQKINLHWAQAPIAPHARYPTPGSADICLMTKTPLAAIMSQLQHHGVDIELGPVERLGALSRLQSIYVRDPDDNLLELANSLSG